MKKIIYMMAGVALASAVSSCVDTEKPVFQMPNEETAKNFIINQPPFQNEFLSTTGDLEDKSTFNIDLKGQPDYGFPTQANYAAQVSLSETFTDEVKDEDGNVVTPANYATLVNQSANSPSMSIRKYDLAVAMCTLLGIDSPESWDEYLANDGATNGLTVYLRGTCEIAGVPSSFVATSNCVSFTNVQLSYAVPTFGTIYICGDCNGFKEPSSANAEFYKDYVCVEPETGSKIYAGTFLMPDTESVHADATGVDYTTQWRFFTELSGWGDASKMVGSNEADFYVLDITSKFSDGTANGSSYTGDATYGKGNWGVFLEEATDITVAVSLVDANKPKVYYRIGKWDVTVGLSATGIREPVFSAPEGEE